MLLHLLLLLLKLHLFLLLKLELVCPLLLFALLFHCRSVFVITPNLLPLVLLFALPLQTELLEMLSLLFFGHLLLLSLLLRNLLPPPLLLLLPNALCLLPLAQLLQKLVLLVALFLVRCFRQRQHPTRWRLHATRWCATTILARCK